jgi:hypothetical protein
MEHTLNEFPTFYARERSVRSALRTTSGIEQSFVYLQSR